MSQLKESSIFFLVYLSLNDFSYALVLKPFLFVHLLVITHEIKVTTVKVTNFSLAYLHYIKSCVIYKYENISVVRLIWD